MAVLSNLITKSFNLEDKMQIIERKFDILIARASDISTELEIEELQLGKKRRREVDQWLRNVKVKKFEIVSLGEEVKTTRLLLPNMQLRNRIGRIFGEIEELEQQGRFPKGLVLNDVRNTRLPLLTPKLMDHMLEVNIKTVMKWLLDDTICRIGIYGMGGVGKTTLIMHIHNRLLEVKKVFRDVCWVTITQSSTNELQNKIAKAVGLDLPNDENWRRRAAALSNMLSRIRKTLLILDDMLNHFPLDEIGVPVAGNGCKIVITTRNLDVCRRMECQKILKIEPLSERDAWKLFSGNLGNYQELPDRLIKVAESIVKECGGLPLAIRTMAQSMNGVLDVNEWKNALQQLKKPIRGQDDMKNEVFPILRFSYDHLNDFKLQKCFLSCLLYPEDKKMHRDELINLWIVEGLLEETENREEQFHEGHTILNKLENSCLLEAKNYNENTGVKMHDLIRDMAINITKVSPRFMVNPGAELIELPHEKLWPEDLEKVSFFHNRIIEIPPEMSPRCPNLSTLFLQYNPLQRISDPFFKQMKALKILNLSHTNIEKLPDSVSDLENLSALILQGCWNLSCVPSLTRLHELRELDMRHTRIKEAPEGFDVLTNLRCLDLSEIKDLRMPLCKILPKFSRLQKLRLSLAIMGKDITNLRYLERLECWLVFNMNEWKKFIEIRLHWNLSCYKFFLRGTRWGCNARYNQLVNNFCNGSKRVLLLSKSIFDGRNDLKFPKNIQFLGINQCDFRVKGLIDAFPYFHNATELKVCEINKCEGIEYIWSPPPASSVITPPFTFSHFKKIHIRSCSNIKKLFPLALIQQKLLPNLLEIELVNCPHMTEMIAFDEGQGNTRDYEDALLTLPNLKIITLINMPNLESICRGLLQCNSLVKVNKENCPMLNMIPISLPVICDSSEGTLRHVAGLSLEWWASLDKDYPKVVTQIRRLLNKRKLL
ncbi:unnamed protein product [Amaranthus hypochondriacus]